MTFALLPARAAACVLAGLLACPATHAGRPMTVDDAAIAAPGQCQLETYALRAEHLSEYWATPACNVGGDWELIPDRLQIDATWGRRMARGGGEPVVTLGLVFQSN